SRVFEKVYLDLQEDEIEFANEEFKELYYEIINVLNQNQELKLENFVNKLPPERAKEVSDMLMDEDKYQLHNWESKDIYGASKKDLAARVVTDTLLNLRRYYVNKKIEELKNSPVENGQYLDRSVIQDVNDYKKLDQLLSLKLNRVV
ncbi:MAG: DNA primase, partial [Bacteroidia bacterium]|nr:DNA primase [Bacteroidia bacterium]